MPTDCISYQNSGYFSGLINDYLDQKKELKTLYNNFPVIENFEAQIQEKQSNFDEKNRKTLVSVLENQYLKTELSVLTDQNIQYLNSSKTFTITTGHQLNLFTGPLYFLYKIISTLNLCKELKVKYPNYNFVPVYWMATEDHDFEEINYFNFKGKKIKWSDRNSGPVGRFSTQGLNEIYEVFSKELGLSDHAQEIKKLFETAYLQNDNLANATRFLANELFGKYGLVILDGDNKDLKRAFIPYVKEELLFQKSFEKVSQTIVKLKDYNIQVNPREINLFYIEDHLRERIILENGIYKINNSDITFTETEILKELELNPGKFSPNVILRPLYQEIILPNLCYIGGGGEIAYWLELKSMFEHHKITFPILLLRNSVLLVSEKQFKKIDKLSLTWKNLFSKQKELLNNQTKKLSEFPIDFSEQKKHLEFQFEKMYLIANLTDKSFLGAVKAQEIKQKKGLENLEKRLLKAQKRKYTEQLQHILELQNDLFPNESLQERQINFSEFYLDFGEDFIQKLIEKLKPLSQEFVILTL